MSKNFLIAIGIGIVCITIAVAGILYMQRGARVGVSGEFLKVRTAPVDENSTIVVVDFRVKNPSDYPFVARAVTLICQDPSGSPTEGITAPELDAKHIFDWWQNQGRSSGGSEHKCGINDRWGVLRWRLPALRHPAIDESAPQ